ncbi:MAG TPA: hypothetical protein PLH23_04910 [Hyphomonadaceae bacterium]|nr:hypothetical protein [Hyphomonadaceae bacterium]HPI47586.1 hypothetical protein [Hyphomonadaceae bacterium]
MQVETPNIIGLPVAYDRPVIFHGLNKSGSLVMADVMRDGYFRAGRAHQYISNYHNVPREPEDHINIINHTRKGHAFFVAHYLYGFVTHPTAMWVTQVRHPVPRALSVHGWMKRNHLQREGNLDTFPDLTKWIRSTRGAKNTQMVQIALGGAYKSDVMKYSAAEISEMAIENLERDFAWFGVAEIFEESIFALASICDIPVVSAWKKDTRNQWREALADQDKLLLELLEETFQWEIRFYLKALELFRSRINALRFGPGLATYKEACSGQYGERILVPTMDSANA